MDFKKGDWVIFKKKYKYGDAVVGNISERVMVVIKDSYLIHKIQVVDVIVKSGEPHYTISTTYLKKLEKK